MKRVEVAVSDGSLCHHVDFELGGGDAVSAFRLPFVDAVSRLTTHRETDEFLGFNPSLEVTASEEGLDR